MTYEALIKIANSCKSDQVQMYLKNKCWCNSGKPKLYIPKKPSPGLFISCDECGTDKESLKRELTIKEFFVIGTL